MKLLLKISIATVSAIVIFLCLGEQLVSLLDAVVLSKPLNVIIEPASLQLAGIESTEGIRMTHNVNPTTLTGNDFPYLESIHLDTDSLVSVDVEGIKFPLGLAHQRTMFDLDLLPDEGDRVTLCYAHSCISWWTPFNINFFIRAPQFWRNCYYTLTWQKTDGRKLIVKWLVVQDQYDRRKLGTWDPYIDYNSKTTLTDIAIYPRR